MKRLVVQLSIQAGSRSYRTDRKEVNFPYLGAFYSSGSRHYEAVQSHP